MDLWRRLPGFQFRHKYDPVKPDAEKSLDEERVEGRSGAPGENGEKGVITASISLLFFAVAIFIRFTASTRAVSDRACINKFVSYSPIREVLQYEWTPMRNELNTILTPEQDDKRWKQVAQWTDHLYAFPFDRTVELNKTEWQRKLYHKVPGQPERVMGMAEVYHQTHCLMTVREYMRGDIKGPVARIHVDHCLLVMRLNLVCQSDMTPVVFRDSNRGPGGGPDAILDAISAPHRCPRWDVLDDWMGSHTVHTGAVNE